MVSQGPRAGRKVQALPAVAKVGIYGIHEPDLAVATRPDVHTHSPESDDAFVDNNLNLLATPRSVLFWSPICDISGPR
jgi:hypothetical protein